MLTASHPGVWHAARPRALRGEIRVPGDKSISHRAILHNILAQGTAHVENLGPGDDIRSSVRCARALGVQIEEQGPASCVIHAPGLAGLREPGDVLDAGNSGTTVRLIAGILAAQPFLSVITGDSSLRSRPMERILDPLRAMGAQAFGRGDGTLLPLAMRGGALHGIDYTLSMASAQVKSCLLLAGALAEGVTRVHEPAATRNHTERMLAAQGAEIEADGLEVWVRGGRPLRTVDTAVPGDTSSAAFWIAAACLHPDARITVRGVGLSEGRTGLLEILQMMGGDVSITNRRTEGGQPVGDITACSSSLQGAEVGGPLVPRLIDEVPILAVAAGMATGDTVITNAAELRYKESDRITAVVRELGELGVRIDERPDGMVIHGAGRIRGGAADPRGDHRMAMALAIAGLVADEPVDVLQPQCVSVSYPGFWEDLERLCQTS